MKLLTFILVVLIITSCKKNKDSGNIPSCVQSAIDSSMAKPKGYYYQSISEYQLNNKTIYLFVPGCCDRLINAYDETCKYLFAPSGGITGCGDCLHPNFFNEAIFIRSVWEDNRP
jgi:hypothetical protein